MVEARAPDGGATRCGEGRRGRDHEEEVLGHGHTLKKRSITDLFAAAPAVDAVGGGGPGAAEDDGEVLRAIFRRTKEMRRRRRLEEAAADERRAAEGNFARKVCGPAQPDPTRPYPPRPCLHHDIVSSCSKVFSSCLFYCDYFLVIDLHPLNHCGLDLDTVGSIGIV